MATEYRVELTDTAVNMLRSIYKRYGRKSYETVRNLIRDLKTDPRQKGQALRQPLQEFWSLHYSRFRIIYRIEEDATRVLVVAAGHHASGARDDVYQILTRLIESGRLDPDGDR